MLQGDISISTYIYLLAVQQSSTMEGMANWVVI